MATPTYTVKKGDTLSAIAWRYNSTYHYGDNVVSAYKKLAEINNIQDPNYIVVGQVLKLADDGSSESSTFGTSTRAKINVFGLQSNANRTIYAAWSWPRSNTEHYQVIWYYDTGDGIWFIGDDSTTTRTQSLYTAPSNAEKVRFKVKPISKKRTVNNKEVSYWTASWSTIKTYDFSDNLPSVPPVPTVTVENYRLTASLDNLGDLNATSIQFQVVKNDSIVYNTGTAKIVTSYASYSCAVDAGGDYKVRCRSVRGSKTSDWSEYSSKKRTPPGALSGITVCKAKSETSVYLEWVAVANADTYELEYATKVEYFDGSDQVNSQTGILNSHYEKTGLESGQEYFFRVRAVNENGNSKWSEIRSVVLGKPPSAPTTWSSTTTGVTGDTLILYWIHNSEDGSSQKYAEIEFYVGNIKSTIMINSSDEPDDEKTTYTEIDTSSYTEGTKIQWRVRTAGVTNTFSEWSTQRTVDIYAPPTLILNLIDANREHVETLESFPLYVSAISGPDTQTPISYHVTVISNESYTTVDSIGNERVINNGEEIYSKNFDISEDLMLELSAGNIDLENNVTYTVICTVSMNSGLTAEESAQFVVAWTDEQYEPNAEIGIDKDTLTAYIHPYCESSSGTLIENVLLSVYRREFDGTFTELATGLVNIDNTFITDPHPALDYARYRIVAVSQITGAISSYDVPGLPVGEKAIVIQWSEKWSSFDSMNQDEMEEPAWSGSMLKLPYNIDISDKYSPDHSLVSYIGRNHPVSYYGTQLGQSSTWKVDIPKDDKDTLYALRRLAIWMDDVYVREPSGSGYWANISVSFNINHCDVTIPVTINVTRVSGGA